MHHGVFDRFLPGQNEGVFSSPFFISPSLLADPRGVLRFTLHMTPSQNDVGWVTSRVWASLGFSLTGLDHGILTKTIQAPVSLVGGSGRRRCARIDESEGGKARKGERKGDVRS